MKTLEQQAQKAFPLVDYVPESSVLHARKRWIEAKKYLTSKGIEVKPLICPRIEFKQEALH